MIPGGMAALIMGQQSLLNGCIASWTTVSGTTLVDDMGNYNGTIYGSPTITNNIITFDGLNDYVKFNSVAYSSKVITISYRSTSNNLTNKVVLESSAASSSNANTWAIFRASGVESFLASRRNVGTRDETYPAGDNLVHRIVEFDNANNEIKVWVSSGEVTMTVKTVGTAQDFNFGTYDLYMGARAGSSLFYAGDIYPYTRIYNKSLTESERNALINEV